MNDHVTGISGRWTRFIGAIVTTVVLMAPVAAIAAPGVPALTSPTNGSLNQPLSLVLNWGSVATATSYGVQVSTSSSFGATVLGQTGLTAASVTVSGLALNTTYYWSANASNASGASAWATAASFTTIASKLAPVNLGTAGNFAILAKTGISTTGTTSIVGNIGVSPIAATAITGFALIMDPSGVFSTSSLVDGKVYAANYASPTPANLTTAVSDMQTAYTDAAGRPTPDYTELYSGNLTGHTLVPGLYKWSSGVQVDGGGAVTISGSATDVWIFQVAQNLTMANGAMVTLSGGAQASNIFWQVAGQVTLGTTSAMKGIILCQTAVVMNDAAAMNGKVLAQTAVTLIGNPVVSSDSSSAAAPAAPVLASPTNGATGQMPALTLSWNSVTGAVSYTVQVSTGSTFANTAFSHTGAGLTAAATGLSNGGVTYYWRASATNAGGTAWSNVWSFSTILAAPARPVLAAPANNSIGQPTSLTLSWNSAARATSYTAQMSTVANFATTILSQTGLTALSYAVGVSALNTRYYWRVDASNAGGASAWSIVFNFTTSALPSAPILTSPAVGTIGVPTTVVLVWGSVTGAASYTLQVSTNLAFSTTVENITGIIAATSTVISLTNTMTYFWRVEAVAAGGTSPWSSISWFTIITTSALPQRTALVEPAFSLKGNSLIYSIVKSCAVEIGLFDMSGRTVFTYNNHLQTSGNYSLRLTNTNRNLSAGHYIVRFKAGAFEKQAVMMVMR